MANTSKPRKKYIPKPINSHYVSPKTISFIDRLLVHNALTVELKLAQGLFTDTDLANLEHFSNWVGFELTLRGRNDPECLEEAQSIQRNMATSLIEFYERNLKKKNKYYIATTKEIKVFRDGMDYFLEPMRELLHAEPYSFLKEYKAFKYYMEDMRKKTPSDKPREFVMA